MFLLATDFKKKFPFPKEVSERIRFLLVAVAR